LGQSHGEFSFQRLNHSTSPLPLSHLQKLLRAKLESAIEKVDLESALEAAAIDRGKGGPASKESLFIAPLRAGTHFTTPLVNSVCSIRFFSSAMVVYK